MNKRVTKKMPFVQLGINQKTLIVVATLCLLYCITYLPGNALIGQAGAVLFVVVLLSSVIRGIREIAIPREWIYEGIMVLIIIGHLIGAPSLAAAVDSFQQILFLILIAVFCVSGISEQHMFELSRMVAPFLGLLVLIYTVAYLLIGEEQIQLLIVPDFTKVLFACSLFCVLSQRRIGAKIIVCIALAVCFWLMREKSSAVLVFVLPVVAIVLQKVGGLSERNRNRLFACFLLLLVLFPVFYLWLYSSPFGSALQEWFGAHLQQRLFNGREVIWTLAFQQIFESPIFGSGFENVLFLVGADRVLTTHNLYVYLALEGGVALLGIFLLLLYELWKRFSVNLRNPNVAYSAAFFVLILIMMDYELALFSKTVVSLFMWIAIGLGVAMSNYMSSAKE